MGRDEIINPRAGGPAKALLEADLTDTNPSQVYGISGGYNYGQRTFEQPNPSTVYLEIKGFSVISESYGQLLSGFVQDTWLPDTQISGIELG